MKDKKKAGKESKLRAQLRDERTKHDDIGLPENIRVVYSEEHNPHDG